MILESYIKIDDCQLFYRHNNIDIKRDTLLFIHGLGESGLCFNEALEEDKLNNFNIIIPDMAGFGRSSVANNNDYAFEKQISRLYQLLDILGVPHFAIIGHSMGGDISTLMCTKDHSGRIKAFVNIESDLTEGDRFITNSAMKAITQNRFEQWLRQDFMLGRVLEWAESWPSCYRYMASLCFCRSTAFLQCVKEIYGLNATIPGKKYAYIGELYKSIKIPKIYCWGRESLSPDSRQFLIDESIGNQQFDNSFHWVMLDQREGFYNYLAKFLSKEIK